MLSNIIAFLSVSNISTDTFSHNNCTAVIVQREYIALWIANNLSTCCTGWWEEGERLKIPLCALQAKKKCWQFSVQQTYTVHSFSFHTDKVPVACISELHTGRESTWMVSKIHTKLRSDAPETKYNLVYKIPLDGEKVWYVKFWQLTLLTIIFLISIWSHGWCRDFCATSIKRSVLKFLNEDVRLLFYCLCLKFLLYSSIIEQTVILGKHLMVHG